MFSVNFKTLTLKKNLEMKKRQKLILKFKKLKINSKLLQFLISLLTKIPQTKNIKKISFQLTQKNYSN